MAAPILIEKRLLLASTAGTLLAFLFQIIAVSTTHWLTFYIDGGHYEKSTGKNLSEVYSGLWRVCKVYIVKSDNKEFKSKYDDFCFEILEVVFVFIFILKVIRYQMLPFYTNISRF